MSSVSEEKCQCQLSGSTCTQHQDTVHGSTRENSGTMTPISEIVDQAICSVFSRDAYRESIEYSVNRKFKRRRVRRGLSTIEAISIVSILETILEEVRLLAYTSDKPPVEPKMMYKTLEERFGVPDEKDRVIDVETDQLREVALATMKLKKIQRDRAFLEKTIEATLDEVKVYGTYRHLCKTVLQEIIVSREERDLIEQEMRNKNEVKYLKNKITEEAKSLSEKLNERDEVIARLKDQTQDVTFDSETQLSYANHWEKARQEQNLLKYTLQENAFTDSIDKYGTKTHYELKVDDSVQQYIDESQSKLITAIDEWQHTYAIELEERDLQIAKLKDERAQHFEELENLAVLFQKHQEEIKAYLEYKAEQARKAAYELFLHTTATRIQAWWRGTMVRRGLGPFRKKKGKGKEKDTKGKGKKGKKK